MPSPVAHTIVGIMIVWPFSSGYFTSPARLFPRMMKHSWRELFLARNFAAMAQEATITMPLLLVIAAWKIYKACRNAKRHTETNHALGT